MKHPNPKGHHKSIEYGSRFEKWTAYEQVSDARDGRCHYRCICDCGTERAVAAISLRNGSSKSCGCRRGVVSAKRDYTSGQYRGKEFNFPFMFGRWTVLSYAEPKNGRTRFNCVCECGTVSIRYQKHLTRSGAKHCGCACRDHLAELQALTVFTCPFCQVEKPISEYYWYELRSGKGGRPRLDGCKKCHVQRGMDRYRESYEARFTSLLRNPKHRCAKEGLPYDLTVEWAISQLEKQDGKCFYTGYPLTLENDRYSISLDRVIPGIGYTQDNVVLACLAANLGKSDLPQSEFIALCRAVTEYQAQKLEG